jgi:hypothetical protein
MKEYNDSDMIRTHNGEGKWFDFDDLNHSATEAPWQFTNMAILSRILKDNDN